MRLARRPYALGASPVLGVGSHFGDRSRRMAHSQSNGEELDVYNQSNWLSCLWVKARSTMSAQCPLYPQHRSNWRFSDAVRQSTWMVSAFRMAAAVCAGSRRLWVLLNHRPGDQIWRQ